MPKYKLTFSDYSISKETMLLPLLAISYGGKCGYVKSQNNDKILDLLEYDPDTVDYPNWYLRETLLRSAVFDRWIDSYLEKHNDCRVINAGCGLDIRFFRYFKRCFSWLDVDFPEIIDLRSQIMNTEKGYAMIGTDPSDTQWLNPLADNDMRTVFISDATMPFLEPDVINQIIEKLHTVCSKCIFVFDCFTKEGKEERSIFYGDEKCAEIKWTAENLEEVENLFPMLKQTSQYFMTDTSIANEFPTIHKAALGKRVENDAINMKHRIITCKFKI